MPPRFFLITLGTPRLESSSGEPSALTRKEIALLAYLVRSSPKGVVRDKLATLFWGERDESRARQSLRHALHQLRRSLGDAIDVSNGNVRVLHSEIQLDATLLEELAEDHRFADALELWQGEFLADFDDLAGETFASWINAERLKLQRVLFALFEKAIADARDRQPDEEIRYARQWTELAPVDETANAHLIDALLRARRAGEAKSLHSAFLERLRSELDVSPSAESLKLGGEIDRALRHASERRASSAALFTPDIVGREPALAALGELWSRIEHESAIALIEGEEGLGKTRLCDELARRIRSSGRNLVLQVHAVEDEKTSQTSTARRVITRLAESAIIEEAPNRALVELSRIAPELRRRFPQLAAPPDGADQTESALIATFRAITTTAPALLIVDDFAHADAASQKLLMSLANALPNGMMVVLTIRPDEIAGAEPLAELGRIPFARRIKVHPLTQREVALLIDSMLPLLPADRDAVSARLFAESGGNPFYVLELMSGMADAGMVSFTGKGGWSLAPGFASQSVPLPPSLRAAIKLRLDELSISARRVLYLAAKGSSIGPPSSRVESGLTPEDFDAGIDELLSRRLLRISPDGRPGYELAHDLIRRIALESPNGSAQSRQATAESPFARRLTSRRMKTAGVGTVLVAASLLVFAATRSERSGSAELKPSGEHRVVVAAFTNETGDVRYDRLGRVTADWLTRGIAQAGLVSVLPPVNGVSGESVPGASTLPDDFPKLSNLIAPSMIISGSIYRSGDSIRFDSQITDTRGRKILRVIDPVHAPASEPLAGIERLRGNLLTTLASSLDVRLTNAFPPQSHVPTYEAYKAFAEGLDDFYGRRGDAASKFLKAHALDTAFMLPLLYTSLTYWGWGRPGQADSLVKILQAKRTRLSPYDRLILDYEISALRLDRAGSFTAAREAATIAPGSYAAVVLAPGAALGLNYPREAVRLLSQIDREKSAAKGLPGYWNILAHSYHLLGRYEDQIRVGKELRRRIPGENRALYYEGRALAALGRFKELDAVLNESLSLPNNPGFGPPGLNLHRVVAEELRAHGYGDRSRGILERGLRFYRNAPAEVLATPRFQHEIGYVLYQLGRLAEARQTLEKLLVSKALPGADQRTVVYSLMYVAEKQRDSARVRELLEYVRANPEPYLTGFETYSLARLEGLRGRRESTMRLLYKADTEGVGFSHLTHHLLELDVMRGYEPFDRWLAPKG